MIVVAFGDSITAGQFLPTSQAWPALLTGHDVIARGVPGETTRLALERFPADVQASGADAVVIQFGHNDANRWATDCGLPRVSPLAFEANLTEMVTRARRFRMVPYLVTLTPTWRGADYDGTVQAYNHLVHIVAQAEDVALIDVRERLTSRGFFLDDGLHLNATGHQAYAALVQAALR